MGRGLPPNWEKHGERNHPDLGKEIHYFNPERLERLTINEHHTLVRHKTKYHISSSVHGSVGKANSIDEAVRKANEYMAENVAYS